MCYTGTFTHTHSLVLHIYVVYMKGWQPKEGVLATFGDGTALKYMYPMKVLVFSVAKTIMITYKTSCMADLIVTL